MKRLIFKATLLSNIIVHADSATEGHKKALDFIPGSVFLGILAKDYAAFDNPYDIFHSDKLHFGDAHISDLSIKSFKVPLSWYFAKGEKLGNGKIWVHHALSSDIRDNLTKQNIQLKQARTSWIVPNGKDRDGNPQGYLMPICSNYAIKSAYDHDKRTSKKGQIFGYKSFESGSEWSFYVDIDESINKELIINRLTGIKYIGKSRSAQYGRIMIENIESNPQSLSSDKLFNNKYLILYAESRLAFFNKYGQPTLQPTVNDFNLSSDWKIDWGKTQARSQIFAPYNFKNRRFLADRVCFEKGSVFVFEKQNSDAEYDSDNILNGIGTFKNEGFGEVIVNPIFLLSNANAESPYKFVGHEIHEEIFAIKEKDITDDLIINWINNKQLKEQKENDIYKQICQFIKNNKNKFIGISSSQWGQIRSIATSAVDFNYMFNWLFGTSDESSTGFLEHGRIAQKWHDGKSVLKHELENKKNYGTDYVVRLATQMQKLAKIQEENNEL